MTRSVFAAAIAMSVTLPSPGASAASKGSDNRFHPPRRIAANCSVDVTNALNAWLGQVPDGSIAVLPRAGCYRVDGTITLTNRWNLTIRGRRTTFQAMTTGDLNRRHIRVVDGGNIRISNVIVRGANPSAGLGDAAWNPDYAFQHAFTLNGVQGAVLSKVQAYDVFGDFVYVGSNAQRVPSRNVQILNSTFDRNGRQGIAVVSAEHVLIQGNSISNVRQAVIDVEPNTSEWSVNDLQVTANTLGPRRISLLSASAYGQVANVAFSGNRIVGTMRAIVEAKAAEIRYSGFSFTNNTATEDAASSTRLMGFSRVDNIYVSGNTFHFRPSANTDLMALRSSNHVLVENNDLSGVDHIFVVPNDDCSDLVEQGNVT